MDVREAGTWVLGVGRPVDRRGRRIGRGGGILSVEDGEKYRWRSFSDLIAYFKAGIEGMAISASR